MNALIFIDLYTDVQMVMINSVMSSPISLDNYGPFAGALGMETVVAVALGALAAIFVGALLGLLVICRRQRCYYVSIYLLTS